MEASRGEGKGAIADHPVAGTGGVAGIAQVEDAALEAVMPRRP
jgi:hypothetical protein